LAAVLAGEKEIILISLIKKIEVPHYAELTAEKLYLQCLTDVELMKYLPEPGTF